MEWILAFMILNFIEKSSMDKIPIGTVLISNVDSQIEGQTNRSALLV